MNNLGFTKEEMKYINQHKFIDDDLQKIRNDRKLDLLFKIGIILSLHPLKLINLIDLESRLIQERSGSIEPWELLLYDQEENGGNCDVCENPWKKVDIKIFDEKKDKDGKIIDPAWIISHYQPACTCYPRCIYCNRWLISEVKKRQPGCQYCCKNGIACWKRRCSENEDGTKRKGRGKICQGILKLKSTPENGYTMFKCDKCDNILKRKIIV